MSINVHNIEQAILDKMNGSSTELELLEYSKMLTELKTGIVQVVDTFASLPTAATAVGHLYYVQDEKTVYWAHTSAGWLLITTQQLDTAWFMGGLANMYVATVSSPVQECTASNWSYINAGYLSFHGVKTDGTMWAWGSDRCGSLGVNYVAFNNSSPIQEITSSTNWTCVKTKRYGSSGLKTDGSWWIWGYGFYLNNCFGSYKISSPVQEFTSSSWCRISADGFEFHGIKTDGTMWGWGGNGYGTLADGTVINRSSPVQEASNSSNWNYVNQRAATKTDGTLWVWGGASLSPWPGIGTGDFVEYSSPVQEFHSATNWCSTDGIENIYNIALKNDGTMWSWGSQSSGYFGNLGVGDEINRSVPTQDITSSTNWCLAYAGPRNPVALKTDGTLWAWGCNTDGRLGDGTVINRSSPVQEASSSTDWTQATSENRKTGGIRSISL